MNYTPIARAFILLVLVAAILLPEDLEAQYYDQWPMGYDWSENQPFGLSGLDFTGDSVRIIPKRPTVHGIGNNSAFICNRFGELTLMTNGCAILKEDTDILVNGDTLNSGIFYNANCPKNFPGFHGHLMLPDLTNDSFTLVLHKEVVLDKIGFPLSKNLFHTMVKTVEDGISEVLVKRQALRDEKASYDQLAAIPNTNDRSWWVIEHGWNQTNEFFIYEVNKDFANLHSRQNIGPEIENLDADGLNMVFSPDGTKLGILNRKLGLLLFDFDRSIGRLSNHRSYYEPWMSRIDSVLLDGICFSPDSKLIYITASVDLYQVNEADASEPITHIIHMPRLFDDTGWLTQLGNMEIGPDCRIYISPRSTSNYLHVIHYPNIEGPKCAVEFKAVRMPVILLRSTPTVSFYHLGTQVELCDSTIGWIKTSTASVGIEVFPLSIYPNPTTGQYVNINLESEVNGVIEVWSESGTLYSRSQWKGHSGRVEIRGENGKFFIRIIDHNDRVYVGEVLLIN